MPASSSRSGSTDVRTLSSLIAAALLPAGLVFGSASGVADHDAPQAGPPPDVPCCPEGAPPPPWEFQSPDAPPPEAPPPPPPWAMILPAAHVDPGPRELPPGLAAEQGMQVKTILVSRSITSEFPEIREMSGVRPDSRPWHPSGRALDIIIPAAGTSDGVALGDQIVDYVLRNSDRFGVQDVIWRGVYHTPGGPSGGGYGHYDHVHVTTIGGGYPSGDEMYLSEELPPPPEDLPPPPDAGPPPPPGEPPPEGPPPPAEPR